MQCESCGFLCLALHNCEKAPHNAFDMYDGIIYCYECAKKICCEKKCICGAVMDYVDNVYTCDNPDCKIIYKETA